MRPQTDKRSGRERVVAVAVQMNVWMIRHIWYAPHPRLGRERDADPTIRAATLWLISIRIHRRDDDDLDAKTTLRNLRDPDEFGQGHPPDGWPRRRGPVFNSATERTPTPRYTGARPEMSESVGRRSALSYYTLDMELGGGLRGR